MRSSVRFAGVSILAAGIAMLACGDNGGTTDPPDETGDVRVTVAADGAAESGITVSLFAGPGGSALDTETTGSDGRATFTDLDVGSYQVEVDVPEGRELAEGEDARKSVTVTANQRTDVEFDFVPADMGNVVEVVLTGNLTFEPSDVTIAPGTTVRWRNQQSMLHTVTPDGHSEWTSASLSAANETFEHTFSDAGEFDYFCEPHLSQGMTGIIRVQE